MSEPIAAVVVASPTRTMDALTSYVSNRKKGAKQDRWLFQSGINGAQPQFFAAQARRNRTQFGKNGTHTVQRTYKNQYGSTTKSVTEGNYINGYHVIQSFARDGEGGLDPKDPAAALMAHERGMELAREISGPNRMATVTTQVDGRTGCVHNHIIVDAVDMTNGKSLRSQVVTHKRLRETNDRVLERAGYRNLNPKTGRAKDRKGPAELREAQAHAKWEAEHSKSSLGELEKGQNGDEPFSQVVLKSRIAQAMADPRAVDAQSFQRIAKDDYGVDVRMTNVGGRRGISYQMVRRTSDGQVREPQPGDRRKGSTLGQDFSRATVDTSLVLNARAASTARRFDAEKKARRVSPAAPVEVNAPAKAQTSPGQHQQTFRSRLHEAKATGNYKKVAAELAAFEDKAVPLMRSGQPFQEADVPKGVTPRFIEQHGEAMDADMRRLLSQRAAKHEAAREAYSKAQQLRQSAAEREMRAKVERNPAVAAVAAREVDRSKQHQSLADKMRAEVKAGDYELGRDQHEQQLPVAARQMLERDLARAQERPRSRDTQGPSL